MVDLGRRKLKKYLFKGFISALVVALSVNGVISGTSDKPPSPTSDPTAGISHGGQNKYDLDTTSAAPITHMATNSVIAEDSDMQKISREKEVIGRNERNSMNSKYELAHHTNRQLNEYNNSEGDQRANYISQCPSNLECRKLGGECIDCDFNESCTYGKNVTVFCSPKEGIDCTGPSNFTRTLICRYCYQTMPYQQRCTSKNNCSVVSAPRATYRANCTVKDEVLCLGRRQFYKLKLCNWTSGYRWSTALALSISLGGFGVDRFYLGLWREGLGKLFSFGGLGVWTLVDVILIATGYVGPADGSVYIF